MFRTILFSIVAAILAAAITVRTMNSAATVSSHQETAYERVKRTGVLRCGYAIWSPILTRNPNTGQLGGIFYDYANALGKALNLKVEWTEEIGYADFPAALKAGRFDGMCAGIWPNASRAREVDFVTPIYHVAIHPFVRVGDTRFDNNIDAINSPDVKIVAVDGEMGGIIAREDYPKAKLIQLPTMDGPPVMLESLVEGKVDVTFTDKASVHDYDKQNPGKIRQVISQAPVRVFGNTIAVDSSEQELRRMLDNATIELINSGVIERILRKYEASPGLLQRTAPAYRE